MKIELDNGWIRQYERGGLFTIEFCVDDKEQIQRLSQSMLDKERMKVTIELDDAKQFKTDQCAECSYYDESKNECGYTHAKGVYDPGAVDSFCPHYEEGEA